MATPSDDVWRGIWRHDIAGRPLYQIVREDTPLAPTEYVVAGGEVRSADGYRQISFTNLGPAGLPVLLVAAADAPAQTKVIADYVCDGVADEVEINAAIIAAGRSGGVCLSGGTFSIDAPIVCQQDRFRFFGLSRGSTVIERSASFAGTAMLTFNRDDIAGTNKRPAGDITVCGFTVNGKYLGTQGTTDGIIFKGYSSDLFDVEVWGCNGYGIRLRGVTAAERGLASDFTCFHTYLWDIRAYDNGMGGILCDSASTDAGLHGIRAFENCGPGVTINTPITEIVRTHLWGNRDNSNGTTQGNGLLIGGSAARVMVSNVKMEQNRGGLRFTAGSQFIVTGCVFSSNSNAMTGNTSHGAMPAGWYTAGASNQRDDLMLDASGGVPTTVIFTGNTIDPNVYASNVSRYAIYANSGERIQIVHNDIGNGASGRVLNNTGSNLVIFDDNTGYVTNARGTDTIASGTTAKTVTHGLAVQPSPTAIQVMPSNNPTNDPGHIWVDNVTSTQFRVNCRADPGASGLSFSWAVDQNRWS